MFRDTCLGVIVVGAIAAASFAEVLVKIQDPVDDHELVDAVADQRPVKEFAAEIKAFERSLLLNDKETIEKLLGKPTSGPGKDFAIPVAQHRWFGISGLRDTDDKLNKDHTAYYSIGNFAGIEVRYGVDGTSPQFGVLYFKMDGAFCKLKKVGKTKKMDDPDKRLALVQKHTIDVDHWRKLTRGMNKKQVAELFSIPAGDYAPGMSYLTRRWGWRLGGHGREHETLEWRSENGRAVVKFDEKGSFVFSEFYQPGHDPITNIAERLKWDREKFIKTKAYLSGRMGQTSPN